jgi:hypothetical protein
MLATNLGMRLGEYESSRQIVRRGVAAVHGTQWKVFLLACSPIDS